MECPRPTSRDLNAALSGMQFQIWPLKMEAEGVNRSANSDLAKAFGLAAERVHSPVELSESLRRWLKTDLPVLIEVVTSREEEPSPWPFLLKW